MPGMMANPSRHASWAFGRRFRAAGILGAIGAVGDALDNTPAEGFFGLPRLELLDRRRWEMQAELASAAFERIEALNSTCRHHSSIGYLSPSSSSRVTPTPALGHDLHSQPVRSTDGCSNGEMMDCHKCGRRTRQRLPDLQ